MAATSSGNLMIQSMIRHILLTMLLRQHWFHTILSLYQLVVVQLLAAQSSQQNQIQLSQARQKHQHRNQQRILWQSKALEVQKQLRGQQYRQAALQHIRIILHLRVMRMHILQLVVHFLIVREQFLIMA